MSTALEINFVFLLYLACTFRMSGSTGEQAVEQRNKKHARLLTKVANFSSTTNFGVIAINTAKALLNINPAAEIADKGKIFLQFSLNYYLPWKYLVMN